MIVGPASETRNRPRVVVVEDDDGVRRSLQLLLQGRGFDVRAYSAAELLLIDDGLDDTDCLVADYRLTGRDGIALLFALRQIGWDGPAILMTAFASEKLSRSAQEAGFDAFIEKPFADRGLVEAIARLTDKPG